jgi:integrating conjugative element protein (TIGR03765 family)
MMKLNFLTALAGLLFSLACQAGLNVIADLGGEDASPYFEAINKQPGMPGADPVMQLPVRQGLEAMLPVRTPELSPGDVTARALKLPGIGALFLVGDDALSRAWLQENADALAERHAAGMIVNVENAGAVRALQALVPGVPLAPASGAEIARRLRVSHYPVLITDTGLSGQRRISAARADARNGEIRAEGSDE